MIQVISRWFEAVKVSQDYRTSDYIVLWLVLAVGIFLRFWGLDNVGLHGDEETMAMPAMAVLETGQPLLPSGMYYPRALINVYLMSASALLFGESEWAFRLPSAIAGSLTGLVAFFMGRRFLTPQFNLAFTATITLLPSMIEISQTARMYVFFVTCAIWFAASIFRWERDQRITSLLLALFVWLLCLHFHILAIFVAPLFFFPGLSRQSWSLLFQGATAFLIGGLLFAFYNRWILTQYPQDIERPSLPEADTIQSALDVLLLAGNWLMVTSIVAVASLMIVLFVKVANRSILSGFLPALLIAAGLLAMTVLHYHLGAILLLFGVIFWLRTAQLPRAWILAPIVLAAILTVVHSYVLFDSGLYSGSSMLRALAGTPSVWPILRVIEYSPFAGVLYVIALVFAIFQFAGGRRIPTHFLFFVMAVWVPLLVMGLFVWDVPARYTIGHISFFILCVFAGIAFVCRQKQWIRTGTRMAPSTSLLIALISVGIINPVALARVTNPGYDMYPDHKGAAAFIQSLNLSDDAILVAEDVLQQTYYLGVVDYWLRPIDDAAGYSIVRSGQLLDQYTGTIVLSSGSELAKLLAANEGREVFIIGSGENFVDGKRRFRGRGIAEVLRSETLEVVYEGRDKKTKVWKLRQ